ncbi:hypothetical protein CVO_08510 [Sulfurimonas sp. CVO]|uniref:hypothetical protein n=1 Tax=Sulfurimonas sp. CVO TaxID=2283483 RepID=UPI00132E7A68|nr:hypothetical protein [Sulfurimonas sp. CVO]QHG91862.1 hypothetical protein CVO_08510 [Sulfurimonas sp. CVO]
MQTKYNIYNTQSTSSYINHMFLVGVLASSSLGSSYETHTNFSSSLPQEYLAPAANTTTIQNQAQSIMQDAHRQIIASNFDFLQVDEKLDKEIDSYLATYSGTDKEILDI